jgi:hypothetical protein
MRELREEIIRLRERLERNERLLKEAGIKAEEMKTLEKSLDRMKKAIEKTKLPKKLK